MIDQQPASGFPFFPIEMKCSTAQQSQIAISNENCNNLNSNTANSNHLASNSISGIVDSSGNSPPSDNHHHHHNHHKSPLSSGTTSTGSTITSTPITNASMTNVMCGGCMQPICDRYIMKVVETAYHERCLQCISCCCNLINTCYQRDNKLFCRKDYERLFVKNRCLGCAEKIGSDELVMRAVDNVFHLKCFICVVCGMRLQKGDQYVVKQSQLFCRPDYEKEVEMLQGYNYDDYCCEDIYHTRMDGRRGPKRPRTILTTQQRRAFKASFDVSPKPCRKVRETLAKDTGLSIRIVQVWFQNQRAKVKKIQKKQLKEGTKPKDTESQEESENESKLSLKIKDENSRSNQYLQDSCSDTEGGLCDTDSFGSRLSGNGSSSIIPTELKHIKEEIDNDDEYFRLLANQTRSMRHLDDGTTVASIKSETLSYNNGNMVGMDYQALQQLSANLAPSNHLLNPIDRLYSMQNQYFCNENMQPNNINHLHHQHHHQMCE
ncbi:LIM homeobox transcription factor 1-beta isoform X2 [Chironomus tepperi]|uniref:LIM homeobox transcription factor 1-beta isoform X2 n=1 Tax=Chironomus tepperi TaxID=113505 RepID=UPI00391F86C3